MFWNGKKNKKQILIPLSGKLISLDEVEDPVFSSKALGDGFAVIPSDGSLYSPVDGKIAGIFETKHAISIIDNDGHDILIHMGIDTVELKGEGFEVFVKEGDIVKAGDKIARMNIDKIKSLGYKVTTPVIFTNYDGNFNIKPKDVEACENSGIIIEK